MAVYAYRALTAAAAVTTGTVVADTPRQVREQLLDRGLTVQSVVRRDKAVSTGGRSFGRRHAGRVVEFTRNLATLLAVGVPLVDAVQTLAGQEPSRFRSVLLQLQDRLAAGVSLAAAMREQPGVFDNLDVSLADVGEAAGTLDATLDRLASFKEERATARGRVGTALIYPAIVLVVAVTVSVLLMTLVVPKLLGTLIEAGRPVPLVTRVVKAASDALVQGWWIGLIGLAVAGVAVAYTLSKPKGRLLAERLQRRLPLVGPATAKQGISRVAVVLSVLMRSGIPFVRAVQIARDTAPGQVLRDALAKCEVAVVAGSDLAAAVAGSGAFPPMVVQMFAVGQQSGRLEEMLDRLAADYDRQVKATTARLAAVLEPALILVMVGLVGTIAFATVLPMLEAADVF